MKRVFSALRAALIVLAVLGLAGCSEIPEAPLLLKPDETYEKEPVGGYEFRDSDSIYDGAGGIVTMYLTVGKGSAAENAAHTWEEVNAHPVSWYEDRGIEPYSCDALLQVGDEVGPLAGEFGYGELTANATVRLRGKGASEHPQKSYRIEIKSGRGNWENMKVVALNKHFADPLRYRNKLAYDLMADIPEMFSARTWFVHLYVKDRSEGEDGLFVDYGLYTAVEPINKKYFRNRELDAGGNLYKAENFDWRPHSDILMPATSVEFDQKAFEELLEIKGDVDHTKLLNMLAAIDDETIPIADTVRKYFDRDNLYYWMAFHILMGNRDIETGNYYLYSPQGDDRFYFISWDNDKLLPETYEKLRDGNWSAAWNHGIFTFISGRLYERMLKDDTCRNALSAAVDDMRESYLTDEAISEKAEAYRGLIKDIVFSRPDSVYERVSASSFDILTEALTAEVESNYEAFKRSLSEPWPFNILEPETKDGRITFGWEEAYLYGGSPVYTVKLAETPNFETCIFSRSGYESTEYSRAMLPAGQYFLYVSADDGNGYSQEASQYYITETDQTVFGTLCFYVLEDGTLAVNEYYEE